MKLFRFDECFRNIEGGKNMADSNSAFFKDKIVAKAGKFAASRFVRAIVDAGYIVISFSIIGAIFLILTVLPQAFLITGFAEFYANTLGTCSKLFIMPLWVF